MKKIALALVLVGFSYGAMAATACGGAGNATQVTGNNANFIKQTMTPRCSSNTWVEFTDGATRVEVGSGSIKGKKYFGGSSEGGAVTARGDCAASGCTQGNAQSGATAAAST